MTSSEKKGVSLVEASSGERPFSQEALEEEDTGPAGMKWMKRKGIWTKHPDWQDEESSTIDPDLFPKVGEEPEAKQQMNWTQVNGIWTRSPEQDPDISADLPEQDPDISADLPEHRRIELTQKRCSNENLLANGMLITPPLKRLRKKQPPTPCDAE